MGRVGSVPIPVLARGRRIWGVLMGPVWGLSRVVAGFSRATRRGIAVFGIALALGLAAASPAAANPWTAAANVSEEGQSAYGPKVAVDATGEAAVVWTRYNGSNDVVQAALKPAGEPWGKPATLSEAGQEASEPQVAVDAAGDAIAVWTRYNGSNDVVQAAVKPAGEAWEKAATLSEAGQNASEPQVAVDPAGDATIVWRRFDGTHYIVQSAVRPAGSSWEAPASLSEAGQDASEPHVGVDAAVMPPLSGGASTAATTSCRLRPSRWANPGERRPRSRKRPAKHPSRNSPSTPRAMRRPCGRATTASTPAV